MTLTWQEELIMSTVLYRALECEEQFALNTAHTEIEFIDDTLSTMHQLDLLVPGRNGTLWQVTAKGEKAHRDLVALYEATSLFDIFANVNLALELPPEVCDANGMILEDSYDPRFATPMSEDLRLPMIDFVCDSLGKKANLHRVVFVQMLADDRLKEQQIWFDLKLGTPFSEITDILASAIRWREIAGTEKDAADAMLAVYQAGVIEHNKRAEDTQDSAELPPNPADAASPFFAALF